MTIYDIAKAAGVSIATVSRVLNASPKVSKATRDRVMAVVESGNYVPSAIAQNLSSRNSLKNIGVICYNFEDVYYARAVSLLERPLREKGYNIILVATGESREHQAKSVNLLISKHVDAIILIGSVFVSGKNDDHLVAAAKSVPTLIVNGKISANNAYSFYCDDRDAVYTACEKLHEKGRTVAYFYDTEAYSARMKLKGFKEFCADHDIPSDGFAIKCESTVSNARDSFREFYRKHPEVSAVVTSNDLLAAGVLAGARESNLSVPSDLRVIGYNDSVICECACPTLTSIDNKIEIICNKVIDTLIGIFDGERAENEFKVTATVTIRES